MAARKKAEATPSLSSPPAEPKPTMDERGEYNGLTWDEHVAERLRQFERQSKQRRLAETERIISNWHMGGYSIFCELLERAVAGGIAVQHHARAILPTLLEVVEELHSYEREADRSKRMIKFGEQSIRDRRRVRVKQRANARHAAVEK